MTDQSLEDAAVEQARQRFMRDVWGEEGAASPESFAEVRADLLRFEQAIRDQVKAEHDAEMDAAIGEAVAGYARSLEGCVQTLSEERIELRRAESALAELRDERDALVKAAQKAYDWANLDIAEWNEKYGYFGHVDRDRDIWELLHASLHSRNDDEEGERA